MNFTVLGGNGFIGRQLVNKLRREGHTCHVPDRPLEKIIGESLGHVIYCIGLTADFRQRPFDTVEAHTCLVNRLLHDASFESFLFLSSARIYLGGTDGSEEAKLTIDPTEPDDLYNITKLAGESICLAQNNPRVRVVRPTNVFGYDPYSTNFLSAILKDGIASGRISLRSNAESAKDYVDVEDVVDMLPRIAVHGQHRVYNIGAGERISNRELIVAVARILGCQIEMSESGNVVVFPEVSISRLRNEFDFRPQRLLSKLENLVAKYKEGLEVV